MIHWDNIGLGLHIMPGSPINAKLHAESFQTIPTQCRQTTSCTTSKCGNPIWCQATILNAGIKSTSVRRQNQTVLFLGRAVDSTLLCPINTIASQSSKPTEDLMSQTLQLLDYLATQEDAELSYHTSNMELAVYSNAS
jgi:hypothetical protein